MPEPTTVDSSSVLVTLLLCGLMGLLGQGVRAALGLKKSLGAPQGQATQQATFNAAYFGLSLMIGFVAGVLAGLVIGLQKLLKIDLTDMKLLLGIVVSGYAGADFIENSLSIVIPNANPQPAAAPAAPAAPPAAPTTRATPDQDTALRTLGAHTQSLNNSVLALTSVVNALPSVTSTIPSFAAALHSTAHGVNTQVWVSALTSGFSQFGISTNKRIAAAIGQFLVEAGANFQEIIEVLTYTHASRLVQIFPNEFPTEAAAAPYVNNPEALGNKVYANKLGNGDEASGDGYRFRGRGLIQLTGRDEYTEFGATVNMTAEQAAAYCETPIGAATSGCWYLSSRGCIPYADSWNLAKITLLVNGRAMTDHAKRVAYSNAMLSALGG
jgi:predicted chitinase